MRKHHFYLIYQHEGGWYIHRFRSELDRSEYLAAISEDAKAVKVGGRHPEVRRVLRRMETESLTWPVEIT